MRKKILGQVVVLLALLSFLVGSCFAALPQQLIPGGRAVGLQLRADGLVVVAFHADGASPAQAAGMRVGDVIVAVDDKPITTLEELPELLGSGGRVMVKVEREGETLQLPIVPREENGTYRLGAYVRGEVSGIGTITYCDPVTGQFGALGHGVNDFATHKLLPIRDGSVLDAVVTQVQRGTEGTPGALRGDLKREAVLGTIERNTSCGVFGTLAQPLHGETLPVARPEEVQLGAATIRSNIWGDEVCEYQVEIRAMDFSKEAEDRNLLLHVADPSLLEQTGGIVQGMSGSPIIQNGKLIGAVTHVLVNDPSTGYGIFIENMLEAAA